MAVALADFDGEFKGKVVAKMAAGKATRESPQSIKHGALKPEYAPER